MKLHDRRWSLRAAVTAAALLAAGMTVLPSPAQAADPVPAPTLSWKISQQFVNNMPVHTLEDGATETAGVVSFPNGVGSYNAANGTAKITYAGSVKGAFTNASCAPGDGSAGDTTCYWVKFANPTVTIADGGEGTLSAEVTSASYLTSGGVAPGSTATAHVVLTTFDATAADWTPGASFGTLTRTPDWENVIVPNSPAAVDAGIPAGQPMNGGAFAPTLIKQLYPSVRSHFYWSTATSANKVVAPFTAEAPAMKVTKKITAANPTAGLTVEVKGSGFRAVTNPGDAGVYVGIAEAGGMPDVSTPAGADAFAVAAYVPSASIVAGEFTKSVNAPTNKLDPAKTYAIYTWQAHSHSNTSQDTTTPLAINFSQLTNAPAVTVSTTSATPADGVKISVAGTNFVATTNPGDAGVYVGVAPVGGLPDVGAQEGASAFVASDWIQPGSITAGAFTRTLTLPTADLDPSKSYAVYTWQAHSHSNTSQDTESAFVIDWSAITTTPAVSVNGPTAAKYGTSPKYTVSVPGRTGDIQVKRNGAVVTSIALVNGVAKYTVPATWAVGTHNLSFRYPGATLVNEVAVPKTLTISKASTKVGLSVLRKATAKKAGRVTVAVAPLTGGPASTGKVVVTLKKGKVTKKVTKTLVNGKVTFVLPKVAKGTWKLKAAYVGSTNHLPIARTWNLKVAKK